MEMLCYIVILWPFRRIFSIWLFIVYFGWDNAFDIEYCISYTFHRSFIIMDVESYRNHLLDFPSSRY